eukprot:9519134-Prorocentrum_lima.AAC.1
MEGTWDSVSTSHGDIDLLRMTLSLTSGRVETITVSDRYPVLENIPSDDNHDVLIEAPEILSRLGIE